jgi:hypothetical protein
MIIPYGATSRGITDQLKIDQFKRIYQLTGKGVSYVLNSK